MEHQKSLDLGIRVFGSEDQEVTGSYSNIGAVYNAQGDYSNVLLQDLKSLEIRIRVLSRNSVEVAKSHNNIRAVYKKQGDY